MGSRVVVCESVSLGVAERESVKVPVHVGVAVVASVDVPLLLGAGVGARVGTRVGAGVGPGTGVGTGICTRVGTAVGLEGTGSVSETKVLPHVTEATTSTTRIASVFDIVFVTLFSSVELPLLLLLFYFCR